MATPAPALTPAPTHTPAPELGPSPPQTPPPTPAPTPIPAAAPTQVRTLAPAPTPAQDLPTNVDIEDTNDENAPPPPAPYEQNRTTSHLILPSARGGYAVFSLEFTTGYDPYPFPPSRPPILERPRIVGRDELVFR